MSLSLFQISALLALLVATSAWINARFFKIQGPIGVALAGCVLSVALSAFSFIPWAGRLEGAFFDGFSLSDTTLHGLLCFLLFAGAMRLRVDLLARFFPVILCLATLSVALSSLFVAQSLSIVLPWFGIAIPYPWLLVFGALISPTDPLAINAALRSLGAPKELSTKIAAESLFNDGAGLALFSIFLAMALRHGAGFEFGNQLGNLAALFAFSAGGGALLGVVLGIIGHLALKSIDDPLAEIAITCAVAIAGFALAEALHVSGPVCSAGAGLIIGNGLHGNRLQSSTSHATREKVFAFWENLEGLLNMILFAMLGILLMSLPFSIPALIFSLCAIPCVLGARFISVAPFTFAASKAYGFPPGSLSILVLGGLRGGISLAMALSLPPGEFREFCVIGAWVVVAFSLSAQASAFSLLLSRASFAKKIKPSEP